MSAPRAPRVPFDLCQPPLLRTVTGSRLYGLAHPDSDHDAWVVVPTQRDHSPTLKARQSFQQLVTVDDVVFDTTYVAENTFWRWCVNGVPQALEVLFSPLANVDVLGPAFRFSHRVPPQAALTGYRRMIGDQALPRASEVKFRRHATRLVLNLNTLRAQGWFTPVLTDEEKDLVHRLAHREHGFVDRLSRLAGAEFTLEAPLRRPA